MASILIVDDSSMNISLLKTTLENAGHTIVAEGRTGMEGYQLYEKLLPDLVTMDISMPEMDGITAINQIKAVFPEAKIIVISSIDQKNKIIEAIKCGAKHYILKPFAPDKVIEVVNQVLDLNIENNEATEEEKRSE